MHWCPQFAVVHCASGTQPGVGVVSVTLPAVLMVPGGTVLLAGLVVAAGTLSVLEVSLPPGIGVQAMFAGKPKLAMRNLAVTACAAIGLFWLGPGRVSINVFFKVTENRFGFCGSLLISVGSVWLVLM